MKLALAAAGLILGVVLAHSAAAGPITIVEAKRQAQVLDELKKSLDAETTDAGKFRQFARVANIEPNVDVRRRIVAMAIQAPGADREQFLTGVLTDDADAGLRGHAATMLGRLGSEKCLPALARAAATDRTTAYRIGDIGSQSSARRAATFAIAEWAARFPMRADQAAAEVRGLAPAADPNDNEHLADARIQALYQITKDDALLQPFYERLQSRDVKERTGGVAAFRFLKLTAAPAALVAGLKDKERDVRSWTALVLGEIGDPRTAAALMAVAGDAKEDHGVRVNAIGSLGTMKSAAAADLMRKLLTDASVEIHAAIALYRITGEKTKSFPKGYNAD